jgi:5'-nucleotidase
MSETLDNRLIIAISSQVLFDLDESNQIFENEGIDQYAQYQRERENITLEKGPGYRLVKKLLKINEIQPCVEIVLMSRNSSDTGLRIFNSIEKHGLNITRAVFTSGRNPQRYAKAFGTHLFLSTNPADVCDALSNGLAAATMKSGVHNHDYDNIELRIAFDGDAVIFSDEAERVFQSQGLEAFHKSEQSSANKPLRTGPFYPFLYALKNLQQKFPPPACPVRTALITARQAPAHVRVIKTLRNWDLRIDETLFLGGLDKTDVLRAFNADIFFDDQVQHCERANPHIPSAHVPSGIKNDDEKAA